MKRFPNVLEAKVQIQELHDFVELAESYAPKDLGQQIIKMYAYTFSIQKTTEILNVERRSKHLPLIDSIFVSEKIKSKPSDDPLHKLVRRAYLNKTKHIRKKPSPRN